MVAINKEAGKIKFPNAVLTYGLIFVRLGKKTSTGYSCGRRSAQAYIIPTIEPIVTMASTVTIWWNLASPDTIAPMFQAIM